MKARTSWEVLALCRQLLSPRRVRCVARRMRVRNWAPLYKLNVVLCLMISEHLQSPGTLAQVVQAAASGGLRHLLPERQRRRMSLGNSGYCHARHRMPVALMKTIIENVTEQLHGILREAEPGPNVPIYIMDGSSLRLPHRAPLMKRFPPAENQHGQSHWPVIRVSVLHEARTGLATQVVYGPMYGAEAVSEQSLVEKLLHYATPGALILGDRNFGIFASVHAITSHQCGVLVRLSQPRAKALLGALQPGTDRSVVWRPSAYERRQHPDLADEAQVRGRVLVCAVAGFRETLYLFTTLSLPAAEVVRLYGLRWNIETDLRSIKQTIHLQPLRVTSEAMIEKQLLAATAAYNLVRTVLVLGAQQANLHPRDLSFTNVFHLVRPFASDLWAAPDTRANRAELKWIIKSAGTLKLPRRKNRRSYPREVWPQGSRYPQKSAAKCP